MSAVTSSQEKNARGIPKAPFIVSLKLRLSILAREGLICASYVCRLQADVAEYLGADPDVESALKEFQAAIAYAIHQSHILFVLTMSPSQ